MDHIKIPAGMTVQEAIDLYLLLPEVEYAEPNYIRRADQAWNIPNQALSIPNDPGFPDLWGMEKIYAPEAWEYFTGSNDVVIAVFGFGVDYNHEDLAANIWINPGEDIDHNGVVDDRDFNGIDDDGNGYVDDIRGWDFWSGDNDPMDSYGSGTHIASIIGAAGNNGIGVAGVNWKVKIMPIRVGTAADVIRAIEYVNDMREQGVQVRVSQFNWVGSPYNQSEKNAMATGGLIVAGVAMRERNVENSPIYPASYDLDNIISVTGTEEDDTLQISDYGPISVDLAAPGYRVYGAVPPALWGDKYIYADGSTVAGAHVTGAAGFILGFDPGLTDLQVKERILNGVDRIPSLDGKVLTGGRLNLFKTLAGIDIPWLSLTPAAGVGINVNTLGGTDILVRYNAASATVGTHYAYLDIYSNDLSNPLVSVPVTLEVVASPVLSYYSHTIDDDSLGESNGNGNGLIEIGESIELKVTLKNNGSKNAIFVNATLSLENPQDSQYINITDAEESFGIIPAGSTDISWDDFDITISKETPGGHTVNFILNISEALGDYTNTSAFAITVVDTTAPGMVNDLSIITDEDSITLTWTAPEDDEGNANSGPVSHYDVRYSIWSIEENWDKPDWISQVAGEPLPSQPGAPQSMTFPISDFPPEVYSFALKSTDEAGNVSVISNIASFMPDTGSPSFGVSTFTKPDTKIYQTHPSVGMAPDGNFVVVWDSDIYYELNYYDELAVYGQRFNAGGEMIGDQFRIRSTEYESFTAASAVAMAPDSTFVVVWEEWLFRQYGDYDFTYEIYVYGQRFNAIGEKIGVKFRVDTSDPLNWEWAYPDVAMDTNGNFVVVYRGYDDDDGYGIFARRFNANGTPRDTEQFKVNSVDTGSDKLPSVAMTTGGNFVVAWERYVDDYEIFARIFDFNDLPANAPPEFQVNIHTTDYQREPDVAVDAIQNFVVVWEGYGNGPSVDIRGIFARRFNINGSPLDNEEFLVSTNARERTSYSQTGARPAVTMAPDGSFVLVWTGYDKDGWGVYGQRYDTNGAGIGDEFRINSYVPNYQKDPAVAIDANGNFIVVWESPYRPDSDTGDIFGRLYWWQ